MVLDRVPDRDFRADFDLCANGSDSVGYEDFQKCINISITSLDEDEDEEANKYIGMSCYTCKVLLIIVKLSHMIGDSCQAYAPWLVGLGIKIEFQNLFPITGIKSTKMAILV